MSVPRFRPAIGPQRFLRQLLVCSIAWLLLLPWNDRLWAREAPPIGSNIPPGERPAWIEQKIWVSLFAGTAPTGKRLSSSDLVPLVLRADWPPPMPTNIMWHLEIGVFLLSVRPDGTVSNVEMLHTTGQRFLDRDVTKAFARWRFRPGSVKEVRVPAHFTVHR